MKKRIIGRFEIKAIRVLGIEIPIFAVVLLSVFAALTVFIAVEQSTKGAELVYLEKKSEVLTGANKELSSKLVMDSSLSKVSDQASHSGMIKPEKTVYLGSGAAPAVAKAQ